MNLAKLFVPLFVSLLSSLPSPAQTTSGHTPDDSAVVSVQQLAMPRKAVRAFQKGSSLLLKGDPQSSLTYLQTAADLAPGSYAPYHNLALAHYDLGHMDEAGKYFQKAIDTSKSSYAPSLFGLSMVLYRQRDYAQAETLIRQGLSLLPNSAVGKYCLGLVQYSTGRIAEAQRSAQDALRLDPHRCDVHLLLAHIYQRQHNPNAVLAEVDAYLTLAPDGNLRYDAVALRQRAQQDIVAAQSNPN